MTKLEGLKAALDAATREELIANYAAEATAARYALAAARDAAWYACENEHEKQKEKKND